MYPLKRLLLGVVLMLVLLAGVAFALPRQVSVARAVVINAPESDIFPYLDNPRAFRQWSPWAARNPDAEYVFSGPESGPGARMEWSGGHPGAGSGEREIVESEPGKYVEVTLNLDAFGAATGIYRLRPEGAGTRVVWVFETNVGANPLKRWMGLMFDSWIGDDLAHGLARLKQVVESGG